MLKRDAEQSFIYHGDRIYSPLGVKSDYHERMRHLWALACKDGDYKRLPRDPVKADEILSGQVL